MDIPFALFLLGLLTLWVASDWPPGSLGAGYLASAHMVQYVLYVFVAAPLMLGGIPEVAGPGDEQSPRSAIWLGALGNTPMLAAGVWCVSLVLTHSPSVVASTRVSHLGSFVMDIVWLASGLIFWLPLLSPVVRGRMASIGWWVVHLIA